MIALNASMTVTINSAAGSRVEERPTASHTRLVNCCPGDLSLHPSYIRNSVAVDAHQLSVITALGDLAFREPLAITQDRIILDGVARWAVARLQGRPRLDCVEYQMSDTEALQYLIQRHRRSSALNDFIRICLALELEPDLKAKSRLRQQAGGLKKGWSILTEADRLDVRREIASIAGVSVGNVTKVKQLMGTAQPEIINALRTKEISIHRAWSWSKLSPEHQVENLWEKRSANGVRRTIRQLVSKHQSKTPESPFDVDDLSDLVSAIQSGKLGTVSVVPIKCAGNLIFVGEGLLRSHRQQKELAFPCDISTR